MPLALHQTFVQNLKEFHPRALLHESIQAGGHGFDAMTSMNEDWVKKGVEFAKKILVKFVIPRPQSHTKIGLTTTSFSAAISWVHTSFE
jgi:hypothetical protein